MKLLVSFAKMLLKIYLLSIAFGITQSQQDCQAYTGANLEVIPEGTITYGGSASVKCQTGYVFPDGSTAPVTINCGDNEAYDSTPSCVIDCESLPTIVHGSATGDTFHGGTAAVSCAEGHDLSGSLTCGSDGTWGTLPTCNKKGLYMKHIV